MEAQEQPWEQRAAASLRHPSTKVSDFVNRGETFGVAEGDSAGAAGEAAYRADHAALAAFSRRGRHVIAERSGHHVQLEDPAMVIRLVQELFASLKR